MALGTRETIPSRLIRARAGVASLSTWAIRRWLLALLVAMAAALLMGIPTGIVRTSFYTRMTPVTWWDYPVWAVSALLVGLTAATHLRDGATPFSVPDRSGRTLGAALLTAFAVGCPVCNKLVVALIGASGAMAYWAPIQPLLGILSIALLATGLAIRLNASAMCPTPLAPAPVTKP